MLNSCGESCVEGLIYEAKCKYYTKYKASPALGTGTAVYINYPKGFVAYPFYPFIFHGYSTDTDGYESFFQFIASVRAR